MSLSVFLPMLARYARKLAVAALIATVAAPAVAGHGYYRHGYHGHHHHGSSSSDGWVIGGILALAAAGLYLAATSEPDYPPAGGVSYGTRYYGDGSPGYTFYGGVPAPSPQTSTYPVPAADAPSAVTPHASSLPAGSPSQAGATAPGSRAQAGGQSAVRTATADRAQCHRHAVNYSGYDPASASAWTTAVSVQTYNRALQNCLAGSAAEG